LVRDLILIFGWILADCDIFGKFRESIIDEETEKTENIVN